MIDLLRPASDAVRYITRPEPDAWKAAGRDVGLAEGDVEEAREFKLTGISELPTLRF